MVYQFQLLQKGHKVTAITNFPLQTKSENYRGVVIDPPWDWEANLNMTEFFETVSVKESTFFKINSIWKYGLVTTSFALDSPVVKNFIETDRTHFDLVISEQFYQEAFNMFAYKYNCPLVAVGTLDYSDYIDRARGALTPWSHVPHFLSYNSEKMTFLERLENFAYSTFDAIGRKFYYLPKHTELARKAFASLENERGGKLPSAQELEHKIALHLMNSHLALSSTRPKMPGMVDIAGIHIKPSKPLPEDIQRFLDEAENGVIYMSFGSFLKCSMMSPEKYKTISDAFRKIKQRVIWKYENETAINLPPNVMIMSWLPQSDILAHKNVKLFISHGNIFFYERSSNPNLFLLLGGIFGSQEAIYHAVPLIIFPFYGDQQLNGNKMQQKGFAIMESMSTLTSESLVNAINRIINNSSYYDNVKKISEIFRTNQNNPLESALWWIEYVIKFKGAPHMQSHAKNLSTFRYLSLDIIFTLLITLYIIYDCIKKVYDMIFIAKVDDKKKVEKKVGKNKKDK